MIISLLGYLDCEAAEALAKQILKTIADTEQSNIVLEMNSVGKVFSNSLGILINLYKEVRFAKGDLHIAAPSSSLQSLLEYTKVNRFLPVYDTVEEAIVAFD